VGKVRFITVTADYSKIRRFFSPPSLQNFFILAERLSFKWADCYMKPGAGERIAFLFFSPLT